MAVTKKAAQKTVGAKIKVEATKNILKIDAAEQILPGEPRHTGKPSRIVLGPFLRVRQNRIGLGNFLKAFFSSRLFIAIGMIFQDEVAKSVLDRFLLGIFGDAQYFVVVTLARNNSSP